ncbi:MAG: alpha/beta hydrolase [SAR324 cluster bacterium]|nr:alpha/beta hydrolase [SAR324 cluster bacterium]
MPTLAANGINIYYEDTGSGIPILFLHEFAGDHRSWETQVRYFSRRYRCIVYAARGFPPSDVPQDVSAYSQDIAVDDAKGVLDALNIDKAHICGLSMGGYASVLFGVKYPERALSLIIGGCGYGSSSKASNWYGELDEIAKAFIEEGMQAKADQYAIGPTRVQLQNKDPRGWEEFRAQFMSHSALGAANTFMGVQKHRPNLLKMENELSAVQVPSLIILGDEDVPAMEASLFMKQVMPCAALEVLPNSGHAINLEEPDRFNRSLLEFFSAVDGGRWMPRDPRSKGETLIKPIKS